MKTVSLKLPDDLAGRLVEAARRRGASKSDLMREALAMYLEHSERGSFAERAADLAGCVSGPEDLASSAEHLDGYGR